MFSNIKYSVKRWVFRALFYFVSIEDVLPLIFRDLNSQSAHTFIYHKMKDQSDEINFTQPSTDDFKFTVIVQGPVIIDKNLTLNVLIDFLKSREPSRIILSTWIDESTRDIELKLTSFIKSGRLRIVKSIKPSVPGISNINLQIMSVRNALAALEGSATKYLLKVRSDQRYSIKDPCSNLEGYFLRYSQGSKFRKIIVTSQNTFVYRNFGASDFLQFGNYDDVKIFWSSDLDLRDLTNLSFPNPKNMREESKNSVCEIYLTRNYLTKIGYEYEDSLRGSLKVFADVFILLDSVQIGLVWTKYDFAYNERSFLQENSPFLELTHERWLSLSDAGLESLARPEIQEIQHR
jgi:hypothetical protein